MKILAIGDFHGEFPEKLESIIKKEKIELIVSNGDYFPFHYRKIWFEHCYGKDIELWEVIGKEEYRKLILKDLRDGEKALKKLNCLPIPVITVIGNLDYTTTFSDANDFKPTKNNWKWANQDFFTPILKKYKNIKRFDYKYIKFKDYVFIGGYGGTNRGAVKSKTYKKNRRKLDNLFKKFKKENKKGKVIFVTHNVPYNTKLDKASMKAHEKVRGKHIGSKLVRRLINTHQPIIHIGGHMHEAAGKDKLKRTTLVNPGAAHEGKAAIINLSEKLKPKVKFIK